jgi:hypothetical protein
MLFSVAMEAPLLVIWRVLALVDVLRNGTTSSSLKQISELELLFPGGVSQTRVNS